MQVFGYSIVELTGLNFASLLTEPYQETYRAFLEHAYQHPFDQPLRMDMDIDAARKDGGVFPIELTLAPFQSGERHVLICSVHEVTVRKRMEQELSEVPRRLLEGLEAERMRLARELHDGPIQEAYGVAFGLRHAIAEAGEAGAKRLEGLLDQTHHVIQTMRDIGRNLRPPTLAHFGLEKTIRADADQFREHHPEITVYLRLQPDATDLPDHLRMALFRIYQNAMGNVARHSQASQVTVRLLYDAEGVTLDIEDDGRGFNFDGRWLDLVRQGHLGLAGSTERADAIGGKLEIDSTPGQGTRIHVTAPLEKPVGVGETVNK
jgi:PAS domain S-box-containing protein